MLFTCPIKYYWHCQKAGQGHQERILNLADHVIMVAGGKITEITGKQKILDEIMSQQRKNELNLYKLYAKDDAFHQAFIDTMKRMAGVNI